MQPGELDIQIGECWSRLDAAWRSFFLGVGLPARPSESELWSLIDSAERLTAKVPDHYGLHRALGNAYYVWQWQFIGVQNSSTAKHFVEKALQHLEETAQIAERLREHTQILPPRLVGTSEGRDFPPEVKPFMIVAEDILRILRESTWWEPKWRAHKVIQYAEPIVRWSRAYHPAHVFLGEAFCELGNIDRAEQTWKAAENLPDVAPALRSAIRSLPGIRARHAKCQGDWQGVVAALSTADAKNHRSFDDLNLLWRALHFLKREGDVKFVCQEVIELASREWERRPLGASELKMIGDAHYELGSLEDAQSAWQQAQDLNPRVGVKRRLQGRY